VLLIHVLISNVDMHTVAKAEVYVVNMLMGNTCILNGAFVGGTARSYWVCWHGTMVM
jgi:hypothetical protein